MPPRKKNLSHSRLKKVNRPKLRRLRVVETVGVIGSAGNVYEVEVLENGKTRCPCKGFRYRKECRHILDPEVRDVVLQYAPARLPRPEVGVLAAMLAASLLPYCLRVEIVGSLRRQRNDVKDIDLIFMPGAGSTAQVVALFRTFGTPVHHGESMGAIVLPSGVPAQLWAVERPEVWGAALLHFIGPRDYNISLRIRANRRGWKLSQHGLVERSTERLIAGRTEQEVLDALDMPWLPPALRADHRRASTLSAGGRKGKRAQGPGF